MKFFNLDCHVSVIADIKNIFECLGHIVDQWSLSGHRWLFNLPECKSPIINEFNWKNINKEMADSFYLLHKNELDQYDAFICAYPPIFLKLFEKFNKPIIVIAATRYDYPVIDDKQRLSWLEDSLNNNKNLILIANNEFDKKYCEKFTKVEWQHIPSLCLYTKEKYNPTNNNSVFFSKLQIQPLDGIIHQSELGKYSWKYLYSFKNIIHLPYNVSTMSMFEQSSAGVPLFFPTLKFSLELLNQNIPLFSEITFRNSVEDRQSFHFLNEEWLNLSDFYNGTIKANYFNSFEELFKIIKNPPLIKDTNNKDIVYSKWNKIIKEIDQ